MSLPTYQLVAALLTLHKEQSRKVKGNAQKELDNYPQGCFTSAAEGIVTAFEQNVIAVVSKPWALMCRALLHKAHNRLEKCVDKLTDALRIASHHSMQSCMGYIYMNLSQTEKLLSSNKMINDVHVSIAGAQRNQPEKGQRMSTAMVTKKGRGGRRKAAVAVAKEAVDLIYMSHARSALDIAERCGLTHVYFSCLKLLDSKASQFGSFRRLSGRQSFMPDTVNHEGGRRRIEALHDQRLGSVVDSGRGDHHASIFDGAANRGEAARHARERSEDRALILTLICSSQASVLSGPVWSTPTGAETLAEHHSTEARTAPTCTRRQWTSEASATTTASPLTATSTGTPPKCRQEATGRGTNSIPSHPA